MSTGLPPELSSSQSPALPPSAVHGDNASQPSAQVSPQQSQLIAGQTSAANESLSQPLKWFVQQISSLQGQLPPSAQDVQQQLLRQLADALTRTPQLALNNVLAPAAQQNLQQWLSNMTSANLVPALATPALNAWLSTLTSQTQDTSALGKALQQWATQLVLSRWPQQLPSSSAPISVPLPASLQWPQQPPTGREQVALETALTSTLRFLQASQQLPSGLPPTSRLIERVSDSVQQGNDRATGTPAAADASAPNPKPSGRPGDADAGGPANTYLRPLRMSLAEGASTASAQRAIPAGDPTSDASKAEVTATRAATTTVNADKPTAAAGQAASMSLPSAGAALRDAGGTTNPLTPPTAAEPATKLDSGKMPIPLSAGTEKTPPAMASGQVVVSAAIAQRQEAEPLATTPTPMATPLSVTSASQPWTPPANMPGAMPLGDYLHQLGTLLAKRNLPDILRPALQQIDKIFTTPLTQGPQIEEWFSFLRQPLFGDSGQSKALLQWGIALLTYRLQQLDTQSNSPNRTAQAPLAPLPKEEESHSHWARGATGQLVQQAERLSPSPAETPPWLIPHLPLPPHYSGGRGGQLSLRKQQGKDNQTQWVLNFSLEPAQLGPIRIKAFLDLPTIRLQTVAERAQTVDRLRENLPLLEARLRDLGLQPEPSQCRQEKVNMAEEAPPAPNDGFSVRI